MRQRVYIVSILACLSLSAMSFAGAGAISVNGAVEKGGDWTADKIHDAMFNDDPTKINRQVTLQSTLPVSVTYLTATADEDGTMHFFDDIYGYDKQLDDALSYVDSETYNQLRAQGGPHTSGQYATGQCARASSQPVSLSARHAADPAVGVAHCEDGKCIGQSAPAQAQLRHAHG